MQSSSLPHCWIIRFNCAKDVGKGLEKKCRKAFSIKTSFFFFHLMESWTLKIVKCHWHWTRNTIVAPHGYFCTRASLQGEGFWVDYISHERPKNSPAASCCGLRALHKNGPEGKPCGWEGEAHWHHPQKSQQTVRKRHVLSLAKPVSLCNKACLRPTDIFFPPF